MATAKPNQKIHVDKLQATREKLEQLEQKQRLELTLRESIYLLRDKLHSALKKGYSYEDLSEILEAQGILISAATLKQYLTESNKAAKGKRGSNSKQAKRSYLLASEKAKSSPAETVTIAAPNSNKSLGESDREESQSVNKASDTKSLQSDEVKLSEENNQSLPRENQRGTSKTVRGKTKKISGNSTDLSSEFNEY